MKRPSRVFDLAYVQQNKNPHFTMFAYKKEQKWIQVSNTDFISKVNEASKILIALDVKPDDKVGLISENRIEWNILDFAIQQIGAVVVGIYPNIALADYEFILNDAEIKTCIVSNEALYQKIKGIQPQVPSLNNIYTLDEHDHIPSFQSLVPTASNVDTNILEKLKNNVTTDQLATLIYTSGTTGKPKGVMLTHKNLLADTMSSEYSFPVFSGDRALTFLPVCHAYERVFHYVYIFMGISIYFAQSMETIGDDMKTSKPHIFSAVPRVLEKVYEKIMATGEQLTGVKRKLFFWALALGERYDLENRSWTYNIQLAIARKLIFSKWKQAIGGHIRGIASGSAALQEKLIRIYLAAGIPIFEGYGLTEAGPCLSVNDFRRGMKIGTVGLPLINISIKLAEDGEILAKGDNIMLGYYKNPEATAEVLQDGWLHTGDIGQWVDDRFLKIVDRKKEMFKTSGGKYIVPQQLESKIVESKFIEQVMIVGEGQKFPAAFIVPSYNNLLEWSKITNNEASNLPKKDFLTSEFVKSKIESELNIINQNFGNWEQIKKIAIIPDEFTIETGELTPTLKMKRKQILGKYKEQYESIYKN